MWNGGQLLIKLMEKIISVRTEAGILYFINKYS